MKKLLLLIFLICSLSAIAQDEGTIVKRERIQRDKNIFVGGGISTTSLDDYSTGINFEGGFSKRVNRVLSIGGSISYLKFRYDSKITSSKINPGNINTFPSNFYYDPTQLTNPNFIDFGITANAEGFDLTFISLAANIKLNFVPIKENTKISVYGFAKPFIARGTSSAGNYVFDGAVYNSATGNLDKVVVPDNSISYEEGSTTTGGIFIGPGIEILPNNPISFFLQASFGYTFPVDQSSIKTLPRDLNKWPSEIPTKSAGFSSINFAAGISFNLD